MVEACTVAESCTVDAELFDSLEQAIAFVAEHGGGTVYTELANTDQVKGLVLPNDVHLEPVRPAAA